MENKTPQRLLPLVPGRESRGCWKEVLLQGRGKCTHTSIFKGRQWQQQGVQKVGVPRRDTKSHQCAEGDPKGQAEPLLGPPNHRDLLVPPESSLPSGPPHLPSTLQAQAKPCFPHLASQNTGCGITPGAGMVNFSNIKEKSNFK